MCGKPKIDRSAQIAQQREAAEARAREEARQARIRAGTGQIDSTFSQFDDGFFNRRRDAVMDFYQPQLEDRFADARDELTFALSRAGLLRSSVAADKQNDLTREYDVQRGSILSKAEADADAMRSRINNERTALVSQLNATGDADRVSNEALQRTQVLLNQRPEYDPLPDIFAGFASAIGGGLNAARQRDMFASTAISPASPRAKSQARLVS